MSFPGWRSMAQKRVEKSKKVGRSIMKGIVATAIWDWESELSRMSTSTFGVEDKGVNLQAK